MDQRKGANMTHIPDSIERMETRIESNIDRWNELQRGVPEGSFKCMLCGKVEEGEPMLCGPSPDAPAGCGECSGYDEYLKSQCHAEE